MAIENLGHAKVCFRINKSLKKSFCYFWNFDFSEFRMTFARNYLAQKFQTFRVIFQNFKFLLKFQNFSKISKGRYFLLGGRANVVFFLF